jgi:hypothetical protein
MKKASGHRKRHLPPGPCGIWFEAKQRRNASKRNNSNNNNNNHQNNFARRQEDPDKYLPQYTQIFSSTQNQDKSTERDDNKNNSNNTVHSAWKEMQNDLNISTPFLPPTWPVPDPTSRHDIVRSNLPSKYVTLWEILRGDYDMKIEDPNKLLLVLVHSVESSIHHNIWTVDLRDDTGASIRAWMEPKFIQGQIQQSSFDDETSSIRPGVVWMLRNVSMIVVSNNTRATSSSSSDERLKRMLLVSGDNIVRIWRPGGNKNDKKQSETVQQHSTIDTHDDRRRNESDLTANGDPNQTQQDASPDSSARKQREVAHTPQNMATSESQDAPVDESTAALWDQLRRSSKPLAARDENRNSIIYKNHEIPSFSNGSQAQEEFDEDTALQNRPLHTGPSLNTQESNVRNVYPLGGNLNNCKPSSFTEGSSQESSSEVHHHTQGSTSKKKKKKGKDKERRQRSNKRSKEDVVMYAATQELSPTGKKETFIVNDNNKGSIWNMSEDTTLLQMIEEDYEEQQETLSICNETRGVNESNPPCKRKDSGSDQDVQGSGSLFVHNTDDWDGIDLDDDGLI